MLIGAAVEINIRHRSKPSFGADFGVHHLVGKIKHRKALVCLPGMRSLPIFPLALAQAAIFCSSQVNCRRLQPLAFWPEFFPIRGAHPQRWSDGLPPGFPKLVQTFGKPGGAAHAQGTVQTDGLLGNMTERQIADNLLFGRYLPQSLQFFSASR